MNTNDLTPQQALELAERLLSFAGQHTYQLPPAVQHVVDMAKAGGYQIDEARIAQRIADRDAQLAKMGVRDND